jgi:predicted RNA-binding protein with PIN domain
MRTIILDGYNVILRSPAFRPDERRDLATAREKLVNLLTWALGSPGEVDFILVFDGADVPAAERRSAGAHGAAKVSVRFSRPPQKADDVIRELVEEWAETRPVTVVTSDLEVARHARANGATIVLSDLFAASLFAEHVEAAMDEALKRSSGAKAGRKAKAGRGAKGGAGRQRGRGRTGSPTAQGSDAESKPEGVSKKNAAEWLRLFEEQQRADEPDAE